MKRIFLISALLICPFSSQAQTNSDFEAAISKFQKFYNVLKVDSVFGMFSDRIKGLLPLEKTTEMLNSLATQLGDMKSFELTKQDERLRYYKTEFTNATLTLIIALNNDHKLETFRFVPYQEQDTSKAKKEPSNFILKTAGGNVYGTLTVPDAGKKIPVVLIIAGSGPTDRDGNSPLGVKSDAYKMIADSLFKEGIACVRYDKRGIAESAAAVKDEESISFDDLVNDAVGFVEMLKADPRFSKVIVLGHSEGSLIGMLATEKAKAGGYISVSGIAERADKIIEKQIATQSKELSGKARIILDSLIKGYAVTEIDPALEQLFRPSVQHYMRSWLKYEPVKEIKKLKVPVLILQGTTDIQVGVDEATKLKNACPQASLKIITDMNHILKQAPADRKENLETYKNPDLPLSAGLMANIKSFIKALK